MGTEIVKKEINIEALISQGLEKGAGIDVMERMFVMAKEMKAMAAREAFFDALSKFQKDTPKIIKEKPVKNKEGVIKYHYAPLDTIIEQVKDNLDKHGFSYTLKTKQEGGMMIVTCEAHHVAGHTEATDMAVPIGSDYMSAQQQVGAALTFAKRYAFCDAFGIMTGDEDTDAVDEPSEKKQDAPPFPKEENKPSEEFVFLQNSCRAELEKQTEGLDLKGKIVAFESTCEKVFGKKKYYKPLDRFTKPELAQLLDHLTGPK